VLVKKFGGNDAVCPEMPKVLTQLAPGDQQTHGLGITEDDGPDRALALLHLLVSIPDSYLTATAYPVKAENSGA